MGLCEASAGEYLFPDGKTGRHLLDVKTGFNAAFEDAGIDDLTFHDLRRTAATRLGEAGAKPSTSGRSSATRTSMRGSGLRGERKLVSIHGDIPRRLSSLRSIGSWCS